MHHAATQLPLERMRRRDEWRNNFPRETERTDCYLQRDGAVAHGDAVAYPNESRDPFLEFPDKGTVIREPIAIQHVVDSFQ